MVGGGLEERGEVQGVAGRHADELIRRMTEDVHERMAERREASLA